MDRGSFGIAMLHGLQAAAEQQARCISGQGTSDSLLPADPEGNPNPAVSIGGPVNNVSLVVLHS